MLLGMTGLGEAGESKQGLRVRMAVAHVVGGMIAGAFMSAAVWLLLTPARTLLPGPARGGVVGAVAMLALLADLGLVHGPHRLGQVPTEYYRKWGNIKAYALYGARFGAAFTTLVPYAATYTLFLMLAITQSFRFAVLGGALFGLGRTLLIGPGSLMATAFSELLYRGRGVRRAWILVSLILSVLLAATQWNTL